MKIPLTGTDGLADAAGSAKGGERYATVAEQAQEMGCLGVLDAIELPRGQKIAKRIGSGAERIPPDEAKGQLDFLAAIK